jgi:hypothetical protein
MAISDYAPPVAHLLTLGEPDATWEWPDYLAMGIGPEQVDDLIRILEDDEFYDAEPQSRAAWAPVHAWRALGQLRAAAAVSPLLGLLWRIDEYGDDWIAEELPSVLAMIGPASIPYGAAFLADPRKGVWARAAAASALALIGKRFPEARDACLSALVQTLEQFAAQDITLNAWIVASAVDLEGIEAAPVMAAAFDADAVDLSVTGDWEDVQVGLGLLSERQTPAPDDRPRPLSTAEGQPLRRGSAQSARSVEREAERQQKKERKARQLRQKEARRKQRQRRH